VRAATLNLRQGKIPRWRLAIRRRPRLHGALVSAWTSKSALRIRGGLDDGVDAIRGRRDPDLPPRWLQLAIGGGDFRAIGAEFKGHFVELGGLRPDHDVLDVGCGAGRMALALSGWLNGSYEGLDTYRDAVDWCRSEITPRHPNFRFQFVDVANGQYNPHGSQQPETVRFPYADQAFDFAFLTSVFTHLLPTAVDRYLAELARVLRPGGVCFATYFLLDPAVAPPPVVGSWRDEVGDYLTAEEVTPERAVALTEESVRGLHDSHGLQIDAVYPGLWSGRGTTTYQDIVIARRR
jgi:SAM-dependent methyltransferase